MLINRDHRPWFLATAGVTAAAGVLYVVSAAAAPYGPSGGSALGIAFGVTGTALMIAAALLSARKQYRTARVGSARAWMSVHIWGGALSVPFILLHSGFSLGGPLTTTLMVLFFLVIASGVYGLILQQFLPRMMTERLGAETIHGQIDHVRARLGVDAYELVAAVTGAIDEAVEERAWLDQEKKAGWKQVVRREPAATPAAGAAALRVAYLQQIRPYLRSSSPLAVPDFSTIAATPELHPCLERLRSLCEESRQLELQRRMHGWLHNWLLLHAPLSLALLALAVFHIVVALRY